MEKRKRRSSDGKDGIRKIGLTVMWKKKTRSESVMEWKIEAKKRLT